jgi:hypothetical protein
VRPALSRTAARKVPCPACKAPAGEQCRGARGKPREANHRERVLAAEEALQPKDTRNWNALVRIEDRDWDWDAEVQVGAEVDS